MSHLLFHHHGPLVLHPTAPCPFRPSYRVLCYFERGLTPSDIYKQNDPHVDALDCGSLLVQ